MACCESCSTGSPCETTVTANKKNWIKGAIKHPGSFRAYAKAHGGMGDDGKVNKEWAHSLIASDKTDESIKRKAQLFLTLTKMH